MNIKQRTYEYRARYQLKGDHVHVLMFSRERGQETYANIGKVVLRVDEWVSFQNAMQLVEFLPEPT